MTAAAEIGSRTIVECAPNNNVMVYVFEYTKLTQNDTIAVATYSPIRNILFAKAQIDADGSDDAVAISGTTITLKGASTGAGRVLVIGKGQ